MAGEQAGRNQERAAQVARLNDAFRRAGPGHDWFVTSGIQALSDVPSLIEAVRTFDAFTPDNDPYGEHDFGNILWQQKKTYWKIDYYDQRLQFWCDPLSPDCRRVMTILLAEEY